MTPDAEIENPEIIANTSQGLPVTSPLLFNDSTSEYVKTPNKIEIKVRKPLSNLSCAPSMIDWTFFLAFWVTFFMYIWSRYTFALHYLLVTY